MDHDRFLNIPAAKRVVVIGDIHGDLQRLVKSLFAAHLINTNMEWIAEPADTVLVQLGDQIDSLNRTNSETWEKLADTEVIRFMDSVRIAAERKGGRVISLLGNHELMNVMGNFSYVSPTSLTKSGGPIGRLKLYAPGASLCNQILSKRPVLCKVGSLLFCHAGLLPEHIILLSAWRTTINQIVERYLLGFELTLEERLLFDKLIVEEEGIVWSRKLVENSHGDVLLKIVLKHMKAKCLIVGHTPHNQVTSKYDGKIWFADVGISRAFGSDHWQLLEIWDDGVPSESNKNTPIRLITVTEKT